MRRSSPGRPASAMCEALPKAIRGLDRPWRPRMPDNVVHFRPPQQTPEEFDGSHPASCHTLGQRRRCIPMPHAFRAPLPPPFLIESGKTALAHPRPGDPLFGTISRSPKPVVAIRRMIADRAADLAACGGRNAGRENEARLRALAGHHGRGCTDPSPDGRSELSMSNPPSPFVGGAPLRPLRRSPFCPLPLYIWLRIASPPVPARVFIGT